MARVIMPSMRMVLILYSMLHTIILNEKVAAQPNDGKS